MKPGSFGRAAAGVIAAAALVRFWRLDLFSVGFDEAMSLKWAGFPSLRAVWGLPPARAPLFNDAWNSLLHFWMMLGGGAAGARALSAAAGVAALVAAWVILSRLLPAAWALAALALFAFSPFGVQYAQEARPYTLVLACELAAVLLLISATEKGTPGALSGWAGCAAAAGTLNLAALGWIAASAVYAWLAPGRKVHWTALAGWSAAAAAPGIALAAWDRAGIAHLNAVAPKAVGVGEFLVGVDDLFGPGAWVPPGLIVPALLAFGALAVVGVLLAVAAPARTAEARRLRAAVIGFGIVPLVLLLAAHRAGVLYAPKPRYAIASQLFLVAAGARALRAVPGNALRAAVLAALLGCDAASLARYFTGGVPTLDLPPCKKPFREVAADLAARARPGDAVLSVSFETYLPLDRYLGGRLGHGYAIRDPLFSDAELAALGTPADVGRFIRRSRRVWVVSAPVNWSAPTGVPGEVLAELIRAACRREALVRPGIRIELWETGR